jgi:hypothetical protein
MSEAEYIVDVLLENLDSLEGVPTNDEYFAKMLDPNSPESRERYLRWHPPKTKKEAIRRGVNYFIQNGRKQMINVTVGDGEPGMFFNSRTMATNRNARRKSFGYPDTFSMRERGWPTAYRNPDGTEKKRRQPPEPPQRYEI